MPRVFKRYFQTGAYYAARLIFFSFALVPSGISLWMGRRLGDLWRMLDRRHRVRAEGQVKECLGLDDVAARRFVKQNFQHYGMALSEFSKLPSMEPEDFERFIDLGEFRKVTHALIAEGKGLVFITAHFGNWEWCNSISRVLDYRGGSIARPLDNPRLDEYVRRVREKNGLRIFNKSGAIRRALGALKDKGVVGVLIDQDAGPQGLMSPFLGKPASTITIPVEMAIRMGSPMLVAVLKRGGENGRRFTMLHGSEPFRPNPGADSETEIRRLVDALNAELGRLIMNAPEQWFWIHRRWKSEGRR